MNDTDFWGEETRRDARAAERSGQRKRKAGKADKTGKKRGGGAAALAAILFLVAVIGGGGYFGYAKLKNFMQPGDYDGQGTGEAVVEVKEGDFTSNIAATLVKADVVKTAKAFVAAAQKEPDITSVQPGFYKMRLKMSSAAAVALLLDPKARAGIINIPEGLWASEIYARLAKAAKIPVSDFRKVNVKSLGLPAAARNRVEGYLFPAQYNLPPKATATQLLKMMVDRFKQEIKGVDFQAASQRLDRTPAELMVIASVVQAEAGKPADQGKVARVVYNRLAADRFLQFDTPVMYAQRKRTIDVRLKHLEIESPYNVYKHKGLPPFPIGNPGLSAIKAALEPTAGPWMFFVAVDPANHITKFGVTEEDFARLKGEFDRWLKDHPQGE